MWKWFTIIAFPKYPHFKFSQASEVLKHPYLQPYLDQYRPSFSPPTSCSPEKPISAVNNHPKNMAESQNSNSSSSDKDSLMSNEKKIAPAGPKCYNKAIETDQISIDDDGSEDESGSSNANAKTAEQEVMKPSNNEHHSNVESKQPKTIRNIMMALKEGKVREATSPMRGNRIKPGGISTQKINTETLSKLPKPTFIAPSMKPNLESPAALARASPDPAKRMMGSHYPKHQVHYHLKLSMSPSLSIDFLKTLKFISDFLVFYSYMLADSDDRSLTKS